MYNIQKNCQNFKYCEKFQVFLQRQEKYFSLLLQSNLAYFIENILSVIELRSLLSNVSGL